MIDILPHLTAEPQSVAQLATKANAPESEIWEAIRVWECESVATDDGMRYRKRALVANTYRAGRTFIKGEA